MPSSPWTEEETHYLKHHYGITSIVELARYVDRSEQEVKDKIAELNLKRQWLDNSLTPELTRQLTIRQLMQDNKRYLPNGWLVGLAMGQAMLRSLAGQIERTETWLEEIEEEINEVLDTIVTIYELTPILSVGDMLQGKDHGQTYRITGREFGVNPKRITYYFTYLYGGNDIPEEEDDWEYDEDDDDDDTIEFKLHNN